MSEIEEWSFLKKLVGSFFGFNSDFENLQIEKYTCIGNNRRLQTKLGNCEKTVKEKEEKIKKLLLSLKDANKTIEKKKEEIKNINSYVEELEGKLKPVNIPSADITYFRPVLIGKNQWIQVEIDVRNFIMPDFEIEKQLRKKHLIYDGKKDLDKLIPKVYRLAKSNYKYGNDTNYGFSEFWMFPYELRTVLSKGKAGDCDDWSIMIGSYFAAANIPRNIWLVSAGFTRKRFGHATIYAKDSKGDWRHLNSTKPDYNYKDLKEFPDNKNESDKVGIKPSGFWFSFNDLFSIHKFETKEALDTYKEEKLPMRIRRRR